MSFRGGGSRRGGGGRSPGGGGGRRFGGGEVEEAVDPKVVSENLKAQNILLKNTDILPFSLPVALKKICW